MCPRQAEPREKPVSHLSLDQSFPTSALLIFGLTILGRGGLSQIFCGMLCSVPGLYLRDAISNPSCSPKWQSKMSPDTADYPLGKQITLGWEPLGWLKGWNTWAEVSFAWCPCLHCMALWVISVLAGSCFIWQHSSRQNIGHCEMLLVWRQICLFLSSWLADMFSLGHLRQPCSKWSPQLSVGPVPSAGKFVSIASGGWGKWFENLEESTRTNEYMKQPDGLGNFWQ